MYKSSFQLNTRGMEEYERFCKYILSKVNDPQTKSIMERDII